MDLDEKNLVKKMECIDYSKESRTKLIDFHLNVLNNIL